MDTTKKVSASTITGFLQSEDEHKVPEYEPGRPAYRTQPPRHQEPLFPPAPPAGYYPYYPPPMPPAPSMSYIYMDLLRHMSLQSELRNYLPKIERSPNENKTKDTQSKKNEKDKCECSHNNDRPHLGYSRLCLSCEQDLRCRRCSKPLTTDRAPSVANQHACNCYQCLLPLHSLMHFQPPPVVSCDCACQKQKETNSKRKSKQKPNKKGNRECLQSDRDNIPERDNPSPQMKTGRKTSKRTYNKDDSCESSDSDDNSQQESPRQGYESDEDRGFYVGEGDENKIDTGVKKSGKVNRVRKTRRSLAYFINV